MGGPAPVTTNDSTPLAGHRLFAGDSPALAAATVRDFLAPHTLSPRESAAGRIDGLVNVRRFQDVTLSYFRYGVAVDIESAPLNRIYAINRPLTGYASVRQSGAEISTGPESAAVFSPSEPFSMRWSPDCTVLCVTVERGALERHLERMIAEPVTNVDFAFHMSFSGGSSSLALWGIVNVLLSMASADGAAGSSPLVVSEVEQALMTSLLLTHEHRASDALRRRPAAASGRTVEEAIAIMRAESGQSISLGEIASRVGVSERALQLSFRKRTGVSPMAYLRQLRLDTARRVLQATSPAERTIAQVASDCGFPHLGRFAQAYHQRFGVKPSQALRG